MLICILDSPSMQSVSAERIMCLKVFSDYVLRNILRNVAFCFVFMTRNHRHRELVFA